MTEMDVSFEDPKRTALFALAQALKAAGYAVEEDMVNATVITGATRLIISCWPRPDDGGTLWYYVRAGDTQPRPLAPAQHVMEAITGVKGLT